MNQPQRQPDGILSCARYAFRPNKLNYCGPDENKHIFEYLAAGEDDGGLAGILNKFETLYPYLKLIAIANRAEDFFNKKVSDAYWIGNELLENIKAPRFYEHLSDSLQLKEKLSRENLNLLTGKMPRGANPHHSFHVFNIWQRTGRAENPHTLYTMDECRVGWGRVQNVAPEIIKVLYEPVIYNNGRLAFGAPILKDIFYELPGEVKAGDWISFHWSSFCEILTEGAVRRLRHWTNMNLELANIK
jgi:hypothetical protein